jgi:hypothetical protein
MADFGVEFRRVGLLDIGSGNELSGFLNRLSYCRLCFGIGFDCLRRRDKGRNFVMSGGNKGGIASGRSAE